METILFRAAHDVHRRIALAIKELHRIDAGLGASVPGHSIRDAAQNLQILKDELEDSYEIQRKDW